MARPTRAGQRSTKKLEVRQSDEEHSELTDASRELEQDVSTFVRQAIGEALADFRERRVFERRRWTFPVDVERRDGERRVRVSSRQNPATTAD